MARSRVIKPEFWSDEKVGELSYMERLLFIGMWNFADDEGLIKAHPSFLKANIFPYDDSLKPESIDKALGNLESKGIVYRYTNNNQKYIWIIKFRVYQRIDKPQKPMNPLPSIQNSGFAKVLFKRDNYICHLCKAEVSMTASLNEVDSSAPSIDHIVPKSKGGSNAPSNLATACISCNKRRGNTDLIIFQEDSENDIGTLTDEEKLKEEKLKEEKLKEDKLIPGNARNTIPPKIEDVTAYCQERKNGIDAQYWWDSYQAKGWMIGNNKMKDWKAAIHTWEKNNKTNPLFQNQNPNQNQDKPMNEIDRQLAKMRRNGEI